VSSVSVILRCPIHPAVTIAIHSHGYGTVVNLYWFPFL
jgi:hypothetical protein